MMERPKPRLIRTPDDAELVAAEWLHFLGYPDVRAAPGAGADGGVDLRGPRIIGQVKATMVPVGRPVVQQTFGIAAAEGCQAVVFSLNGFTTQAVDWADTVGVMLFSFDLQGEPLARSAAATAAFTSNTPATPVGPDPSAISEVMRLAGQIIESGRSVSKEVEEGMAAKAGVDALMPDSIQNLQDLGQALDSRPPESLFESQAQIDALDSAIEASAFEDLELSAAMRAFAALIDEFAAECKRLGLLDESAPQPLQDLAQPFIEVVKDVGRAVYPLLPKAKES